MYLHMYQPITGAGVQWTSSLLCIHGGAEYGLRYVVMETGSCLLCGGEVLIVSVFNEKKQR